MNEAVSIAIASTTSLIENAAGGAMPSVFLLVGALIAFGVLISLLNRLVSF